MDLASTIIGNGFARARPVSKTEAVLDSGKSPAEWVQILADKGIVMSERSLRERANHLGFRIKLGRNMVITDEHMAAILREGEKWRSNRTKGTANGGRKAGSNTKAGPSPSTSNAALDLAMSKAHGTGAGKRKRAG